MKGLFAATALSLAIGIGATMAAAEKEKGKCPHGGYYHGHGMSSVEHLDFLKDKLKLSDAQEKKIFRIGTEYREKYFEARKDPKKTKDIREAHRKAIEAELNDTQKKKFREFYLDKSGAKGKCPHGK